MVIGLKQKKVYAGIIFSSTSMTSYIMTLNTKHVVCFQRAEH